MGVTGLAEAVILQAICDLFSTTYRTESVRFLTGQGFHLASEIAKLSVDDRIQIQRIFRQIYDGKITHNDMQKAVL